MCICIYMYTFIFRYRFIQPIYGQCSHYIPPEDKRTTLVFRCSQGCVEWDHLSEIGQLYDMVHAM